MKKEILIAFLMLLVLPTAESCSSPIFYNQYGVPVNIYLNGVVIMDEKDYPGQKMVNFTMVVNNTDKTSGITLYLVPSGLNGYLYVQPSYYIPANKKGNVTVQAYVDGPDRSGTIYITGACDDGPSIAEGLILFGINGRGNAPPQTCNSNDLSCGTFPNCQDISGWDGCQYGYYRNYFCSDNNIMYSESCTNFCCQSYVGSSGFCGGGICKGTPPVCENECDFAGRQCMSGDVYSCETQLDGCKDLIIKQDCGQNECLGGSCYNASQMSGKVAYMCRYDACNDGIEDEMISWLGSKNWLVVGKAYNKWTDAELNSYDLIVCSDETSACKTDSGTVAYNEHKNQGKPFIEIADDRYAHAAYRFNYLNNPYEFLETGNELYKTATDLIINPFQNPIKIFNSNKKMVIAPDYRLSSGVADILDLETDHARSVAFKMKETGNQGRYVYLGWFYSGFPSELTLDGINIFNRTVLWAKCGDACLADGSFDYPPVAIAKITPNPLAYVNQSVEFDASQSYDPEGHSLTYYWDFNDSYKTGWISTPKVNHTYTKDGKYNITLIVNDGKFNSTPLIMNLTILPQVGNRIAFVCQDDSCSQSSEQALMAYLRGKNYTVEGKSEGSWGDELKYYDFMVCTSSSGCSIHSFSKVYKMHTEGMKGFLEVPDYNHLRAAYQLGYVSWWSGYRANDDSAKIVASDPITQGYSGDVPLFTRAGDMGSIFHYSMKSGTQKLLDVNTKDASTGFKVDSSGTRGRYSYVGWVYKSSYADLTPTGEQILMRTIRWVQCGNVNRCG